MSPSQPGEHDRSSGRSPGARVVELVAVMDRLRTECPWDAEQTHRSLARYLLEETHEVLEAIESDDDAHLCEELGDLLLQVVFHARVAAERGAEGFDIDDVADGIITKLVRRHPHVFAEVEVADAAEVNRNWEQIKAEEKQRDTLFAGIPRSLPALAYASKALDRLARAGLDLPAPADSAADSAADPAADSAARPTADPAAQADAQSWAARALALVEEARSAGQDAEQALRVAVDHIVARLDAADRPGEPGAAT